MAKEPTTPGKIFEEFLKDKEPQAMAWIKGSPQAPYLNGLVKFYETPYGGVLAEAEIFGLPGAAVPGSSSFYAIHICQNGGMPPLLACQGYGWTAFYDKRLTIPGILNRSVVIHQGTGDVSSQPSGDSENRIGCGVIRLVNGGKDD